MENLEELQLEDLGYNSFFEKSRIDLGFDSFDVGRVISESKGAYKVKSPKGEFRAQVTGKHVFQASSREDYPAVGDWVAIEILNVDQAVIRGLLPRLSVLRRRHGHKNKAGEKDRVQVIAANVDVVFVIESVDRDYNLNRFERYFTIAKNGGAESVIVLNKVDLLSEEELDQKLGELRKRFPAITILTTSVVNDGDLSVLKNFIAPGRTYCFLGSSGVGKSSLINKLLDDDMIRTGEISSYSDRGKHTTTSRQMYFLKGGGVVIDNPGVREVGIAEAEEGIDAFFDEISRFARECKYVDCTHTHEPDCGVMKAVKEGDLDESQYSNYLNIKKEVDYSKMSDLEKRETDRQFGKFKKRMKKEFGDYGM